MLIKIIKLTNFILSASAFCSCSTEAFNLLFSASMISSLSVFLRISAEKSPDESIGLGVREQSLFEICFSSHSRSLADWRIIDCSSSTFSFC